MQSAQYFEPTPGPGSYDPRPMKAQPLRAAVSSAFRSKSERFSANPLREMGDPGTYRVQHHTLASNSSNSFSSSVRSGAGSFNSTTERAEWGGIGRVGPGPAYNPRPNWLDQNAKRGRLSAGFATKSKRLIVMDCQLRDTPTFTRYRPEDSHKKLEKPPSGGDSLRSRSPRFASDATISPGPGGHVPNNHTLARAANERLRDARQSSGTREDLFRTPRVRVMSKHVDHLAVRV